MSVLLAGAASLSCAMHRCPVRCRNPSVVSIRAAGRLNPSESGDRLATTVRLYQLKDVSKLQAASLEQLLDNDRAVLGDDLVSVKEITLYPDEGATPAIDRRRGAPVFSLVVRVFFRPSRPWGTMAGGEQAGPTALQLPHRSLKFLNNTAAPKHGSSVTSG